MAKQDYEEKYTHPDLREKIKEAIKASDKGGEKGQWSARKSQLLAHEYEAHGGGYRHEGERTQSQEHLREWTEQEWHTADGDDRARGTDGTRRYLPEAAWQLLSDDEREATDRRKQDGDEQHVANTDAAKEARKAAELLDVDATEARKRVSAMSGDSQLDRAERAERDLGKGRRTVLEAIERRRDRA